MAAAMGMIGKLRQVLASPGEFFDAAGREKGLQPAAVYALVLSAVFVLCSAALTFIGPGPLGISITGAVTMWLVTWIIVFAATFLIAGLAHVFVSVLGGKEGYANTFRAIAYGNTPAFLLGWIPYIGFAFSIWSLYLNVIGIERLQNMTTWRALGAMALAVLTVVLAIVAAFMLLAR